MNKYLLLILALCTALIPNVLYAQDEATIAYGESYIGTFTDVVSSLTVGFDGMTGDVIYINALDNIVPVEFTLFSPTGGQIAISDNTYIGNIELTSEGRYTVVFTRPEWSSDEGDFTAHLGRHVIESLLIENDGQTLFYEGSLDGIAARKTLQVDMEEGELVTMIYYAPNGSITIAAPDGSDILSEGVYNDPDIPLYRLPMTGTYTVSLVTAEAGGAYIAFYLFTHEVITVTSNVPINSKIYEDLPLVFAFDSVAGKKWDINATVPENGDSRLAIYQFNGGPYWESILFMDYGSGPNGQPRIRPFIPEDDATYYIALWHDNWETEYEEYDSELIVSPSTVLSLPNNSPIVGEVNRDTGVAQYAYVGKTDQRIRVKLKNLDSDGVLALNMYSSEDEVVTFVGRNSNSASFEVTLPFDGTYEFVVDNVSYDDSTTLRYEILIEPIEGD